MSNKAVQYRSPREQNSARTPVREIHAMQRPVGLAKSVSHARSVDCISAKAGTKTRWCRWLPAAARLDRSRKCDVGVFLGGHFHLPFV